MADWNNPNPINTNPGGDTVYQGFTKTQSNFDDVYSKLNIVKKLQSGTTAPSNPAVGELWFDETSGILKRYDGTGWVGINVGQVDGFDASQTPTANTIPVADDNGKINTNWIKNDLLFKNKIINGDFAIWQRGTSFTGAGYTADRWRYDTNTDDTVSVTQQATTGTEPFNSQYFVNISLTAGTTGTYNKFSTRLEFPKLYFGKTYTLSFYAKADVSTSITTKLAFVFSGTEYNPVSQSVSIGTSWQRYEVTFTLGTPTGFTESGSDYLDVAFLLPVLTTVSIDIANIQLEEGDIATDFEYVPYDVQLMRCMRYYESKNVLIRPVDTVYNEQAYIAYIIPKRAIPTISFMSDNGIYGQATVEFGIQPNINIFKGTLFSHDIFGFSVSGFFDLASNYRVTFKYFADAEL